MLDQSFIENQEIREMESEPLEEAYIKPPCRLYPSNSDFEVIIYGDGYKAKTRREAGFQWLWKCTIIVG